MFAPWRGVHGRGKRRPYRIIKRGDNINIVNVVNKEERLLEWAGQNPHLTDNLKMTWLSEHSGSCSVVPVSGEAVVEEYVDGSKLKRYDFILQVLFSVSDSDDGINVENMFTLRQWQDWIEEMEREGNYPDFGVGCGNYKLQNLSNTPQLAQVYDNGAAKYQFPARLLYTEE